MKRLGFISCLLFIYVTSLGQKIKQVEATYTYYTGLSVSIEEAERIALERAKLQALEDAFGTVMSQSNSTIISNRNGETDMNFYSIGNNDIKGEWIETIGQPKFTHVFRDNLLVVTCSLKGKVREITDVKIKYEANPLRNGTDLRFADKNFKDGDDLYFYFKTPVSGFLMIFLLDENDNTVYRLLPYKGQNISATPVHQDKEYIFFSTEIEDRTYRLEIDEYRLSCEKEIEFNTLYIIFSPTEIYKGMGYNKTSTDKPSSLTYGDFISWLSNLLANNPTVQFDEISISISK